MSYRNKRRRKNRRGSAGRRRSNTPRIGFRF